MSAAIQGIYIALFGRPADPGGLAYWTEVTKGGADLSAMLSVLPNLTEYTARFEGQTPDQVITTVYQNLFGRAPDAEGLAFFKGQLASGAQTLATIAVNIMQGAQGDDKADVTAKVGAAELFTASLDTPEEIAAYQGADAAALAKKFLDTVDKDKPATPESVEKAAGAVVAGQDPTGGQAPNPGGGGTGGTPGPVETSAPRFGEVSPIARDGVNNLFAGSGNSTGNFEVTTTNISQIELALKGHNRGIGDVVHADGVYKFKALDKAGFAFSVASLGGKTIDQLQAEGYTVHLKIDKDATSATDFVELKLERLSAKDSGKAQDSGYNWSGVKPIIDDEGNANVTQNIQTPIWYGAAEKAPNVVAGGLYDIALEVRKGGSIVATETITLDIAKYTVADPVYGMVANNGGSLLVGTGISAAGFQTVSIDIDQNGLNDLHLSLGAQKQGGTSIDVVNGRVAVGDGVISSLQWSVESEDGKSLAQILTKFDIKLYVDTDATAGTSLATNAAAFNVYTAKADATSVQGPGALDWSFNYPGLGEVSIVDDGGNATVSQNSQALSWIAKSPQFNGPAAAMDGEFTVVLAVYEKGTTNIVGSNTIYFDAA